MFKKVRPIATYRDLCAWSQKNGLGGLENAAFCLCDLCDLLVSILGVENDKKRE